MSAPKRFGFQFALDSSHPVFPGHFPGHPIVPGALLLAHVLTGVTAEMKRAVSGLKQVKFAAALLPNETAVVDCEAIGETLRFSVQAGRAGSLVTLVTGTLQLAIAVSPQLPGPAASYRSFPT